MNNNEQIREILSRGFATLESNRVTGERVESENVTGRHFLAEFEIENIINALNA